MSEITARSIVTLVIFFVINGLVIWPIKIPIPHALGLAYRRLVDAVENVLGFGPIEEPVWGGNSDGTRQDDLAETRAMSPSLPPAPQLHSTSQPPISTGIDVSAGASTEIVTDDNPQQHFVNGADTPALQRPNGTTTDTRAAKEERRIPRHFKLGLVTAPPAGVLLLLASTCITGKVVREGIVAEPIRPFDVMILFLSFAYIALSLDQVGLLRYLAFLVAKKATEGATEEETNAPSSITSEPTAAPPPAQTHVLGASGGNLPQQQQTTEGSTSGGSAGVGITEGRSSEVKKKGKSAQPVFLSLYALFILISTLAGNDPIVLSGTPFVAYFSASSHSPPEPYAFMELYSANAASAILVSSNPTNLVLSAAFGLSFLSHSAWMVLPTLAAVVVLYPVLAIQWRKELRKPIKPPDVDPRAALVDPAGAVWASTVFLLAIVTLVVLSATGRLKGAAGVWSVAGPAAILVALRDGWHDWRHRGKRAAAGVDEDKASGSEAEEEEFELHIVRPAMRPGMRRRLSSKASSIPLEPLTAPPAASTTSSTTTGLHPPPVSASTTTLPAPTRRRRHRPRHPIQAFRRTFPTVSSILPRLPFPLVLFALSFFVLVRALDPWVIIWARWWAIYVSRTGLAGAIFMMALLGVVGSNVIGTNIGACVLFSRIVEVWWRDHGSDGDKRLLYASILTLASAVNYGAFSFTFSASLAGLLWKDLLYARGIRVRLRRFCWNNLIPLTTTMVVSCLVIAAEVCIMY